MKKLQIIALMTVLPFLAQAHPDIKPHEHQYVWESWEWFVIGGIVFLMLIAVWRRFRRTRSN